MPHSQASSQPQSISDVSYYAVTHRPTPSPIMPSLPANRSTRSRHRSKSRRTEEVTEMTATDYERMNDARVVYRDSNGMSLIDVIEKYTSILPFGHRVDPLLDPIYDEHYCRYGYNCSYTYFDRHGRRKSLNHSYPFILRSRTRADMILAVAAGARQWLLKSIHGPNAQQRTAMIKTTIRMMKIVDVTIISIDASGGEVRAVMTLDTPLNLHVAEDASDVSSVLGSIGH
ncbi:hypothetical protein BDW22DRAFT_1344440 [Trametopsis cervina]|nr:hypothetical protein BDW22DRAFT_1344440 [Trametopsis cervina]